MLCSCSFFFYLCPLPPPTSLLRVASFFPKQSPHHVLSCHVHTITPFLLPSSSSSSFPTLQVLPPTIPFVLLRPVDICVF